MVPVCSPAQTTGFQFPGSQLIRDLWLQRDEGVFVQEPEVMLMRLFASHAGIVHFRVEWKGKPLLLFADMKAKEYSSAWSYQNAKAVITTRQNVTMGLKKGNTVSGVAQGLYLWGLTLIAQVDMLYLPICLGHQA